MRLILAFILSLFITPAFAQSGHLAAGQVFGNVTGSEALGSPTLIGPLLDQGYTCTAQGSIMMRGASLWSCLGPGSTAGKPLVSGGAGANLTYSTLTVVGGGTGLATLANNAIYKGQGTSAIATSALTDNGTVVSSSESIDTVNNAHLQEIANAGTTGTTVNKLAKLTGSPATAVIATTSDTTGNVIGIVTGGAGTTGNAQIAITGQASCVFDGAITAGHYVQVSTSSGGECHDGGTTLPTTGGQILGLIIAATNASPGSTPQAVTLYPPGIVATTSSSSGTVTNVTITQGTNTSLSGTCSSTSSINCTVTGTGRQLLTANTTYYIRTVPVAVTISNASPGVVTHTSHGYAAGQLVTFNSTVSLPTGLVAGTVYCVLAAGLTTNTYEVGATCGGSAINTSSAGSGTFTEQAGNDLTGTGASQTATSAFMTLQGAAAYISQNIDTGIDTNVITVQAACSGGGGVALYSTGLQVLTPFVGSGIVKFLGDIVTDDNCVVSVNGPAAFQATYNGVRYQMGGFKLINAATGGDGIYVSGGAQIDIVGPIDFNTVGSSGADIELNHGALYNTASAWTVSGGGARHIYIHNQGYFENAAAVTVTATGTPSITNIVLMTTLGVANASNMTYSGSVTGVAQRYSINNNSDCETGGGGANYFFGVAAGGVATGGIYN
jgi:hypothetical protein